MKKWLHKIEVFVDKIIPFLLILLLVVIVMELGFHQFVEEHHLEQYVKWADYVIIFFFFIDLCFKYSHVRKIPLFLRKYWLDIIAVFPFFLVFRVVEGLSGALSFAFSESAQTAQAVLHQGVELEKEGVKVVREVEVLSRSSRFQKFLRPIFRLPRFVKGVPKASKFYEHPKHRKNIQKGK